MKFKRIKNQNELLKHPVYLKLLDKCPSPHLAGGGGGGVGKGSRPTTVVPSSGSGDVEGVEAF